MGKEIENEAQNQTQIKDVIMGQQSGKGEENTQENSTMIVSSSNRRDLFQPETEVRYGIIMEKICTKLRRLALVGAYPHKVEVTDLLGSSLGLQKELKDDSALNKETKEKLITRVDTLNWFMGSLVDEIQEVEKLNQTSPTGNQTTATEQEADDDFDYVG